MSTIVDIGRLKISLFCSGYQHIQQIKVPNILNMLYTLRYFLFKMQICFIFVTYLVPVSFIFCIQNVLKFKKKLGAKILNTEINVICMFCKDGSTYQICCCNTCVGSLFVSILCTCWSHFSWYCFISFTMFCAPVFFFLIHCFFSLSGFVIPSKCLKNFICPVSKRCFSLFFSTQASLPNFRGRHGLRGYTDADM